MLDSYLCKYMWRKPNTNEDLLLKHISVPIPNESCCDLPTLNLLFSIFSFFPTKINEIFAFSTEICITGENFVHNFRMSRNEKDFLFLYIKEKLFRKLSFKKKNHA